MSRTKALAIRRPQLPQGMGLIVVVGLVALVVWLLMRQKPIAQPLGTYLNKEEWDISYDKEGLPTKITIHRDARSG